MKFRTAIFAGYLLSVAIWVSLVVFCPQTHQLSQFLYDGRYPLWDHVTFRTIADAEDPYLAKPMSFRPDGEAILRQDVCYPALACAMIRLFPNTPAGGWSFVLLGTVLYLGAAANFLRRYGRMSSGVGLLLIACSFPVILSVHVGNMILFAAAAALAYLTWYDSESRAMRVFAAICLAVAAVLKVVPVLLGIVYLGQDWRRHVKAAILSALAAICLLLIPFAGYGGPDGFLHWLENASLNAQAYVGRNTFGVYGIVTALMDVLGYRHEAPAYVFRLARAGSVILAGLCLVRSLVWRGAAVERLLLVTLGMIFLPPTAMIYFALYALPILLALATANDMRTSRAAVIAFVALSVPLQVPLLLGNANACFSSVALIDLALVFLWKTSKGPVSCG